MNCHKCENPVPPSATKLCPVCGAKLRLESLEKRRGIVLALRVGTLYRTTEDLRPVDLRDLTSRIHERLHLTISRHGGDPAPIQGGLFIFSFGLTHARGDEPIRALEAVQALRQEFAIVTREEGALLDVTFAISYGQIAKSTSKKPVPLSGPSVSAAMDLCRAGKPNEILMTKAFVGLAQHRYLFEVVKGRRKGEEAFRYVGKRPFQRDSYPILGRAEEIKQLETLAESIKASPKGLRVSISGAAGIGKTRLLAEFRSRLQDGAVAHAFLQFSWGPNLSFEPFQALFRALVPMLGAQHESSVTPIRAIIEQDEFWNQVTAAQLSPLLFKLLLLLVSDGPFVLCVEDFDRAGETDRKLLEDLARQFEGKPFTFVATLRKEDSFFSQTLLLRPIGSAPSRQLLETALGAEPPETSDRLLPHCNGNPYVILELARAIRTDTPIEPFLAGGIRFLANALLDSCTATQLKFIQRASLFGSRVAIARLAKFERLNTAQLLDTLESSNVFHTDPEGGYLIFQNDLLRELAYERIPADKKEAWHIQAAEFLQKYYQPQPEEVATHYLQTSKDEKALHFAVLAAERLARTGRITNALEYAKRAEALSIKRKSSSDYLEALDVRLQLEWRPLNVEQGLALLDRTFKMISDDSTKSAARFSLMRARFLYERSKFDDANLALQKISGKLSAKEEALRNLLDLRIAAQKGKHKDVVKLGFRFLRAKEKPSPLDRAHLLNVLGYVTFRDGEIDTASGFFTQAYESYQKAGDLDGVRKTLGNLGAIAARLNQTELERDRYLEACDVALRMGDLSEYCTALRNLGRCHFRLLKFSEALSNYRLALDIVSNGFHPRSEHVIELTLGATLRYLGEFDEAEQRLEKARAFFGQEEDFYHLGQTERSLAWLRMEQGKLELAHQEVLKSIDRFGAYPNQLQLSLLLKAEIEILMKRSADAKATVRYFQESFQKKSVSDTVRLHSTRLNLLVNEGNDKSALKAARTVLQETSATTDPTDRLLLLSELSTHDPKLSAEGRTLTRHICDSVPDEYRKYFKKKPYISKLLELI